MARTPWGGTRIAGKYKASQLPPEQRTRAVGESWELSVEPDFPAQLEAGPTLQQWIDEDPLGRLGDEHARGRSGTALLVKLLDAADNLSVQIHPEDEYAGLAEGEAGKPESWYVLEADQGAGLYLGFKPGTDEQAVRAALAAGGGALHERLQFVPVQPGDFFLIEAGTPHAIGAGLTLIEPQHVAPGRRGLTYRYWDWDRTYDGQGRPDPEGQPRALHLEDALAVTRWTEVTAPGFPGSIRRRAGVPDLSATASLTPLCGPSGPLASPWLQVSRLHGTGQIALPPHPVLAGLCVVEGRVELGWEGGQLVVEAGRSAALPPRTASLAADLSAAHAILTSVV